MKQTKLESVIESSLNTGSGFLISLVLATLTFMYAERVGVETPAAWATIQVLMHTLVSLVRNYFWRRFFGSGKFHNVIEKCRRLIK